MSQMRATTLERRQVVLFLAPMKMELLVVMLMVQVMIQSMNCLMVI